jgi:DNA repair protein RecN (Recombination protein N)
MLTALDIRDLLLIDRLELSLQPGLNVLTGETGAGKSILLDSLGFVLGWRGRAELVREGAEQGEVVAEFNLATGHPARAVLNEAGFDPDDGLVIRRINRRDGRKTAWINDRRVSGDLLRSLSETLVELHGQHDDRGLLNARGHRDILDGFAAVGGQIEKVQQAWRALGAATAAQHAAEARLKALRDEEEFLRHSVDELTKMDATVGEEPELDARRRLMQGAERIRADIVQAAAALGNDGAEGALSQAMRWMDGVADKADGQLDEPLSAADRAMAELGAALSGIEACLDMLRFDSHELEVCEERLFAIRALARKHQVAPDDLPKLLESLSIRLADLDAGAEDLAALNVAISQAKSKYDMEAKSLSAARINAAARLDSAMAAELAPLRMERAVFRTVITQGSDGAIGRDLVEFTVATNPGAPSGPLAKIASGGELSRFLLALKVCLSAAGSGGRTMIFDEIDRGVGGATADAVGRRLAALAEKGQVLVVTHSPQVAALGAFHWRVSKDVTANVTTSRVVALDPNARAQEIGRMLAGDRVTPEALAAAKVLMGGQSV